MEITGKRGKCRRNIENSKSESRNTRLTCGCEVRDGDFWKYSGPDFFTINQ